eukprot:1149649-Pyramimonas_sp.AAC.1
MCRRRKRPAGTWGDYWSTRIRHARMLLFNASRPPLEQLTMYRQWLFAQHVACTARGSPERHALENLSR